MKHELPKFLYHGTSADKLGSILANGIEPRRLHGESNWKHSSESHPDAVYLTNAYAFYFADHAGADTESDALVLRIDTDELDPDAFFADEDAVEQLSRMRGSDSTLPQPRGTMHERTAFFRKRLTEYNAVASLKLLGNCTYFGTIPPWAISAAVRVPRARCFDIVFGFGIDPIIEVRAFQMLGQKYIDFTNAMFDPTALAMPQGVKHQDLFIPIPL